MLENEYRLMDHESNPHDDRVKTMKMCRTSSRITNHQLRVNQKNNLIFSFFSLLPLWMNKYLIQVLNFRGESFSYYLVNVSDKYIVGMNIHLESRRLVIGIPADVKSRLDPSLFSLFSWGIQNDYDSPWTLDKKNQRENDDYRRNVISSPSHSLDSSWGIINPSRDGLFKIKQH